MGSIAPIPEPVHLTSRGIGCSGGSSARLFLCACCGIQVLVCRQCDRGQIYCCDCGRGVRRDRRRAAGRRYQLSHRGRMMHARRAHRYRARAKIVTHHGSPPAPPNDLVASRPAAASNMSPSQRSSLGQPPWFCHVCGDQCSEFVRQGFLKRRGSQRHVNRRGVFPDGHPP